MKLTSREKNFIILALAVVFCSVVFSYVLLPQRAKYIAAKEALAVAKNRLSRLKAVSASKEDPEDLAKKMAVQMAVYTRALPTQPETAELLYYLNTAAQATGAVLERYEKSETESLAHQGSEAQKGETREQIRTLPVRIRVMGTFGQLRAFLLRTENLQRITHNKQLVINELPEQQKLEGIMEFEAFYKHGGTAGPQNNDIPPAPAGRQSLFKY